MVRASISFFILGCIAYILGAYAVAGLSIEIGKILLFVFLALSVVSFLVSLMRENRRRR
jgi:uncharacterized membrane protein YtjA (UPF0391 family)